MFNTVKQLCSYCTVVHIIEYIYRLHCYIILLTICWCIDVQYGCHFHRSVIAILRCKHIWTTRTVANILCTAVTFLWCSGMILMCWTAWFLVQDVIYTSRAYAMMSVSVCLSISLWHLCIVVTWCNGSRISLHAWIDWCLCYLLTTPHPDRRMGWCRDFWWKR